MATSCSSACASVLPLSRKTLSRTTSSPVPRKEATDWPSPGSPEVGSPAHAKKWLSATTVTDSAWRSARPATAHASSRLPTTSSSDPGCVSDSVRTCPAASRTVMPVTASRTVLPDSRTRPCTPATKRPSAGCGKVSKTGGTKSPGSGASPRASCSSALRRTSRMPPRSVMPVTMTTSDAETFGARWRRYSWSRATRDATSSSGFMPCSVARSSTEVASSAGVTGVPALAEAAPETRPTASAARSAGSPTSWCSAWRAVSPGSLVTSRWMVSLTRWRTISRNCPSMPTMSRARAKCDR
ncbi:hypothetical protein COSO111634_29155 [Corallococcus soli]